MITREIALCVIILTFLFLLTGCSHKPPPPPPFVPVSVPVTTPCKTPAVQKPVLPLDTLPAGADLFEQVRAILASVEMLEGYARQLDTAAGACR